MTQYPNEKDPHSSWVYPPQEGAPAYPPPTQGYTSRDGAPAPAPAQNTSYAPPSQYQAPQGYYPAPQAPPPDYGYAVSHPDNKSAYDRKGDDTWVAPPGNPYDAGPSSSSAYDQKGDGTWVAPPGNNPYAAPFPDNTSAYAHKGEAPPGTLNNPYDAPLPALPPEAGPSSSTDATKSGVMVSLAAFFGNKGPPPMWQRQPPAPGQLPYDAFPPMCLISNGKDLTGGFPELPPPCQLNPHPFVTHDVAAEDWKR